MGCWPDGRAVMIHCVAGRFRMPSGGAWQSGPLQPSDEQPPPPMSEEFWGEPEKTSLRRPSQAMVCRSRAEAYLSGSAWTPGGRPAVALRTRVRIGSVAKEVDIVGHRHWTTGRGGTLASEPEPFTTMPLRYELAYGGTVRASDGRVLAQEPSNPVGRGLFARAEEAEGQQLPNLYAPGETSPRPRQPARIACYGAIPPSWQPRVSHAGTYDTKWVEERAPLWPRDLDVRHFCAAAEGLSVEAASFRPGEPVELDGFSPDGAIRFVLPDYRLLVKSSYGNRTSRKLMDLDAILLEPDELSVTLYWREVVPLGHGAAGHQRTVVRLLESWESSPS